MQKYYCITHLFSLALLLSGVVSIAKAQETTVLKNNTNTSLTPARVTVDSSKVLSISLKDAIRKMLENNTDIKIARADIKNAEFGLNAADGVYDFNFSSSFLYFKEAFPISSLLSKAKGTGTAANLTRENYNYSGDISKKFSSGGFFQLSFTNNRLETDEIFTVLQKEYKSNLSIRFRQPFLRNFRINEEQRIIKAKRKELDISDLAFRQKLINLIAETQKAYYELVFAIKNEEIYREAVELAATQLNKTQTQIEAGRAANVEAVSAQAHLELRNSEHLSSLLVITKAENHLKKLMFDDPNTVFWFYSILPTDSIDIDHKTVDLETTLRTALANRLEIQELNAETEINKVNLEYFVNQLKPQLDFSAGFVGRGLIGEPNNVGQRPAIVVIGNYFEGLVNLFRFSGYNFGVDFSYPISNKVAKANRNNALIIEQQLDEKKKLTIQKIIVEVRDSVQELEIAAQKVKATKLAVDAATEQLAAEEVRYEAELSTNFLVFSRQNLLSFARGEYVKALTDYHKAKIELQRVMGNNLQGIFIIR